MKDYRARWCEPLLSAALKVMPVVVVTGARQTGKTTLVRHAPGLGERRFLSLDQFDILEQAERDPDSLLDELPVTIDEVQRAPSLLLAIKRKVDAGRRPGMILLTGSANFSLFDKINESLAGRASYLELPPFCPAEARGEGADETGIDALMQDDFSTAAWPRQKSGDWQDWMLRGGYPGIMDEPDSASRDIWFSGYVQTYLERDLRQLSNVGNLADFQRVMRLASLRLSRLVNQSDLSRESGVPQPTVHRYLNLLETGYQVARLTNYQRNAGKSLARARKLQWTDAGLGAWLAGISTGNIAARDDRGFFLEQLVFQTLQSWRSLGLRRHLHFWREGTHEVDFVIEENGVLVGIEVKAGRQVRSDGLRGLLAFQHSFAHGGKKPRGIVLYAGPEARSLGDNLYALPLAAFAPGLAE
ncbi:putative ATPase (AAA+ superfamily) [Opitutaceae bacterium TAV1]|nr:putative ATPase (AAA+ superfamily) [Opitutaceae bacterium TAV1]